MTEPSFDCVIAVCDDAGSLHAVQAAYGGKVQIVAPSIARPEFLKTLPANIRSMTDLASPREFLAGKNGLT